MLKAKECQKHCSTDNVLSHDVTDGRKKGKRTSGRRRLQILHDQGDGYAAFKQAAEERKGWRYSGITAETAIQHKTKEDDGNHSNYTTCA